MTQGQPRGNGLVRDAGTNGRLVWAYRSDRGLVRETNEDFAVVHAFDLEQDAALFVVADGLGGHAAGEVASQLACAELVRAWGESKGASVRQRLRQGFRRANEAVFEGALVRGHRGMATTLTALAIAVDDAAVGHVGDTRCYRIVDGRAQQLTSDHSQAGEMLRRGLISPRAAASHPNRSVLTRCLGRELDPRADVFRVERSSGDVFVLASDGLWDLVGHGELAEVTSAVSEEMPDRLLEAVEELTKLAIYRGAPDNVTIMLVKLVDVPEGRASSRLFRRLG